MKTKPSGAYYYGNGNKLLLNVCSASIAIRKKSIVVACYNTTL